MTDIINFFYFLIALLISLTVHEASHALVAYYLGDSTAKMKGRLTLNPIAHLDLMGSLVFLATRQIGWGKPVPINPSNFKNPVKDSALTALAGPVSNFILAFTVVLPWKYLMEYLPKFLIIEFQYIFYLSLFLGLFNLFPFPPLDGSKIIGLFVPRRFYSQYINYLENGAKFFVVIILVDVFILRNFLGFSIFSSLMGKIVDWISVVLWLGT